MIQFFNVVHGSVVMLCYAYSFYEEQRFIRFSFCSLHVFSSVTVPVWIMEILWFSCNTVLSEYLTFVETLVAAEFVIQAFQRMTSGSWVGLTAVTSVPPVAFAVISVWDWCKRPLPHSLWFRSDQCSWGTSPSESCSIHSFNHLSTLTPTPVYTNSIRGSTETPLTCRTQCGNKLHWSTFCSLVSLSISWKNC